MRELSGKTKLVVFVWCVVAALFHIYTAGSGPFEQKEQRAFHLLLLLPPAFLLFPSTRRAPADKPSLLDWLLSGLALIPNIYILFEAERISMRFANVDPVLFEEILLGTIAIVLLLEATRRAVSVVLAGIVALGIAYLILTEYSPGILAYRNMPFPEIVENLFLLNGMGMYGSITGISATLIAMFIIFGAFIEGAGVGNLFHNLGAVVAGRQSGGPAKVEVISSAMFGTISGSSVANVFATGSFTIPAMIKLGYRRHFAAGVEAGSSVGGQIMPPVMGAAAFVMSELTNIPYGQIATAAILGAVLYFGMILTSVHLEAKRDNLARMDEKDIPTARSLLRDVHLLLPVFLLIGMLASGYSPSFAAFWATISVVPTGWLRKHTRLYPSDIFRMLANGGRNMIVVALACAAAGIVVSSMTVTGLVVGFSSWVMAIADGSILIAGALLMVTTIALGMGLPATAAYIIGAAVGAPPLIEMGVPLLAAHMFVLYFSVMADATPPVCIAAYAAAAIAKADPMKTGFTAMRLASAGFLVGFSYLYSQELLLEGTIIDIGMMFLLNGLALFLVAGGFAGYLFGHLGWTLRVIVVLGGVSLILAHGAALELRLCGAAFVLLALRIWQSTRSKEQNAVRNWGGAE